MAKYERTVTGEFNDLLERIDSAVLHASASASFEDGSDYRSGSFCCATRVYERYSMMGGNRVSMAVTLAGVAPAFYLSVITSGGSQAMFWKVNTFGEEAFLDSIAGALDRL